MTIGKVAHDVHADVATAFWQPFTIDVAEVPRSYCTRPQWSTPGESAWMRLAKFSWCNHLTLHQMMQLFAKMPAHSLSGADVRRADRIRDTHFHETFGLPATSLQFAFCVDEQHHLLALASKQLRYCPTCLSKGFHAALFQWRFTTCCPIHRVPLRTGCPQCRSSISYRLDAPLADSPLQCVQCRVCWIPCLARPAGRCTPLSANEVAVLEQWARYLSHAVGPGGSREAPAINPSTGRFSAARTRAKRVQDLGRFAYLSTLAYLYSTPPPDPTASRPSEHSDKGARVSRTGRNYAMALTPHWPREHWPHFDAGFIALEHMLDNAKEQRLRRDVRHPGQFVFDANDPCIHSTKTMTMLQAATLGWCMSWYGYSRPQSIFEPRTCPAMGLAAWLASLPQRARETHRDWFDRVAHWLRSDLVASWEAWHRLAEFMRPHNAYFLHPALAKPADFARLQQQ